MKPSGFSLIELMLTVGIIGLLANLAMPTFEVFTIKAKQAEMLSNSHLAAAVVESALTETNFDLPDVQSNAGYVTFYLAGQDPAECNQPNPFGFAVPNCAKTRYAIRVEVNSQSKKWDLRSVSIPQMVCKDKGANTTDEFYLYSDYWMTTSKGTCPYVDRSKFGCGQYAVPDTDCLNRQINN